MKLASQLYLGTGEQARFCGSEIKKAIRRAVDLAGLELLAIWCPENPNSYKDIITTCREYGVAAYLWFPVLADIDSFEISESQSVILFDGSRGHGTSGKWSGLGKKEKFLFLCPNDKNAVARNFLHFEKLLDSFEFDGVMLDRIRYPSFANGLEALFSCFCDECTIGLKKQIPPLDLTILTKLCTSNGSLTDLLFGTDPEGLLERKKRSVFEVVEQFSGRARQGGLKVGLDLFAPCMSGPLGQDYRRLATVCDWIKPMLYCHALGPAGLPLEIGCLVKGIRTLCPQLNDTHIHEAVSQALGFYFPEYEKALFSNGLSETVAGLELEKIQSMGLGNTEILAGIEAMDGSFGSPCIKPENILHYRDSIRGRADGIMASWNLLYFGDENLSTLGSMS